MGTVTDESGPPDLLSSVSIDSNSNLVNDRRIDDQDSSVSIEDANLVVEINNLHCPFIWKPEDSLRSYNCDSVEEITSVNEISDEASSFKLRKFVIHLILCYNNFCKRLLEKSLRNLDEMEKMLLTSMKNRCQDVYFTQINDALFHILNSCRVVMFHTTNQKEKARQVLRKIIPYEDLNPTNQAGIWAVRANLYVEFGYEGTKAALQYIERSTEIDDNNPYWHFTRGTYLGRLRRIESGLAIPSRDEIASLELAMKLKNDASFMAFAAEVYVETVNCSKKKSQELLLYANETERRNLEERNNMINERAAMLFKKSVEMNSNCAHLLFRCGKGMLKLTPPHQDVRLAHKYLKKGLEMSYESSFGNHAMALYYMKHENNYEMAKKYLIKATESKNYGADIDLIRVNFLVNRNSNELLDSLLKLFDRYQEKMKHRKILAEIISYYLFIDYNLTKVIDYMNKLLYLIGDHDDIISIFKSGILRQRFPVSLLEILLSDIVDRSNKNALNANEEEECRKFMERLCFQNVNIPRSNNGNLRKNLVKEIKANFESVKVGKVNRSPTRVTEKSTRKEYNPAEGRFEKEYAQKYYAQEEPKRDQKTIVDEFFENYEVAAAKKIESFSTVEKKPKDGKFLPIIQELFSKAKGNQKKDNSSEELSEGDEEIMSSIAKKLDLHLRISARSESKRTKTAQDGASTSYRSDNFDEANIHRRRSSRSPRKRSRSRESRRAVKDSSYKRSDSRDSYRSTREAYRKRSSSNESHSAHRSYCRRSPSRGSHRKRSPSMESNISYRTEESSSRRRSKRREDSKSSRRSPSPECRYSVKSNHGRSSSQNRRSTSSDKKLSRRERSKSRESIRSSKEATHKKRSLSRESRQSSVIEHSRRNRSVSKEIPRRRSRSRESCLSPRRKRSMSRESRHLSRRSISRENDRSPPRRKRSMSRESRQLFRRRSVSREKRSISKESYVSDIGVHRKRSTSRESRRSSKPEHSRRKRSGSRESYVSEKGVHRKRSTSRESRRSPKTEGSRGKRSLSKERYVSDREHRRRRSNSNESYRSKKGSRQRSDTKENSKLTKSDPPPLDSIDSKTVFTDSEKPISLSDRSHSRESRRSRTRSPRLERENYSRKFKKDESDHTLTEFSSNDSDYDRNKSKKSHRSDRYQKDHRDYDRKPRPRSYSSDETRSIHSRRSSSKESRRSKRISSRDRRDDYHRKRNEKKYRKYSSSEDSSSYSSSESSNNCDRSSKSSRHRKSSRDNDFEVKDKSKKDIEKSESKTADEKVTSAGSSSVEKQKDPIPDNKSDHENDAQIS